MNSQVQAVNLKDKLIGATQFFLTALCLYGVAGMLGMQRGIFSSGALSFTLIASTSFVLIPALGGAFRSKYGVLIFIGLIFCWMGDMFGPVNFMYGLTSFLLAHCLFIGAFLARGVSLRRMRPALIACIVPGAAIAAWLLPHVPTKDLIPVCAYMTVLSAMAVIAFGVKQKAGYIPMVLGGSLFYVSDIFVARNQFIINSVWNAYACYPMYYASCILLGLSVYFGSRPATCRPAEQ